MLKSKSCFQNLRHVCGDSLFEVTRLGVQGFEFLVQLFKLGFEILIAYFFARCHAYIAAGVERPALRFDIFQSSCLAQARHVSIFRFLAEDLLDLRPGLIATKSKVNRLASIESNDVGDETDLRERPVAVRAVHLPVDVAGISETFLSSSFSKVLVKRL